MAADKKSQETQRLFAELERYCSSEEYDNIVKICDKISRTVKNDPDVLHSKVVALIRLERYTDALTVLEASNLPVEVREDHQFEKAYCLYRANRLSESLDLIRQCKNGELGKDAKRQFDHLEAQVLYRQEDYGECLGIYQELLRDVNEDEEGELASNYNAVRAAAVASGLSLGDEMDVDQAADSYEVTYNLACLSLADGKLDEAEQYLQKARKQCRDALLEEEYAEEEIERELGIIVVQLAYVRQLQGKTEEASELYKGVLKAKVGDAAVTAVASNNLVAIKKNHELFESAKRYRAATASGVEQKLTRAQKKVIAMNGAILSLYMNKFGPARDAAKKLAEQYPDDDTPYLILAGASYREKKKMTKAIEELQLYCEQMPGSLSVRLALSQIYISQNNYGGAIALIQSFFDNADDDAKYQPGIISLLVWLYGQVDNVDKAVGLLQQATEFWKSGSSELSNESSILKQLAAFKLKSGRPREAAADYERLVRADPQDVHSVAGLIMAYSEFDPALAERYKEYLPADTGAGNSEGIDASVLEVSIGAGKPRKQVVAAEGGVPGAPTQDERMKKKRKRKPKLPKNFDPNVQPDPERWLPKRERAAFAKKGKHRRDVGKGPQGVNVAGGGLGGTGSANIGGVSRASVREAAPQPSTPPSAPATPPAPEKTTPSQSGGGQSNKKKKKGKK
ncbi:Signal recognition particle core component [Borealophlyctis nickersoniae]|nr:Signal recognition particle core component [Borealophlyctis nickersoniae]